MKTTSTMAAQGDCLFRKIPGIPEEATERPVGTERVVVAHSETGHHHSIDVTTGVRLFDAPGHPLLCYLRLEGVDYADVVHHRSFDTHETLRLLATPGGTTVFEVRRQREYSGKPEETASNPVTWVPVQD